jgi:GNAT superfamily N-acetyltransferase
MANLIDEFGRLCREETDWDFAVTSTKRFEARQLGVLVAFNPDDLRQPIGYVTYSKCKKDIQVPEGMNSVSPCVFTDLYVIASQRRKGHGKQLLQELVRCIPQMIYKGTYNYSYPATDEGWRALKSTFPDMEGFGWNF